MKNDELVAIPTNPKVMRFNVELKNGKTLRVQTELRKSACFAYGNRTSVAVFVNEELFQLFDTRYDKECNTVDGYRELMTEWVNNAWLESAKEITQLC